MNPAQIVRELDELESLLLQCRSVFPTLKTEMIGSRQFTTAPYYMIRGFEAAVELKEPITQEFIDRNQQLGKWVNQNAIIRLHGIMDYYKLLKPCIDQSLAGWREVDLMRRMRNAFTKTPLTYIPEKQGSSRLRDEVIEYFGLNSQEFSAGEIPTPIDVVIAPLFDGCRNYIRAKLSDESPSHA